MPIYMDVHNIPGVKARAVAEAHHHDLLLQEGYGCKCMTYWVDEERENVFCLIEAPAKEVVEELHSRAHGLVPNKIIEVDQALVASFLGRIYDPEHAEVQDGYKVFKDPSFRIILVTATIDPVLLHHRYGGQALEMLERQKQLIRQGLAAHGGREVEQAGPGFIGSFTSASKAIACAQSICKELPPVELRATGFRIGIHGGEPVSKTEQLFGDTIAMARHLCRLRGKGPVVISSVVQELVEKDHAKNPNLYETVSPSDEMFIEEFFCRMEAHWQDPGFNVSDCCRVMAMSKSQLYRKLVDLFELSPNLFLKDYRLQRARELMKKRRYTISQITFDSGFTSPSYFTKCFKKKYGLLPMAYLDLLH